MFEKISSSEFEQITKGHQIINEATYLNLISDLKKGNSTLEEIKKYRVKDDYTNITETLYVLPILEQDKNKL